MPIVLVFCRVMALLGTATYARSSVPHLYYHGSGFDPDVFKTDDDSNCIWANDTAWTDARIRFCCKKFYSETRIGRLMLLRDDEPEIYGRDKSIGNPEHLVLANEFTLVRKIHLLLWALFVLVGLILFRLWK